MSEPGAAYLDALRARVEDSGRHFMETHARYCVGELCAFCHPRPTPARPLRVRVCLDPVGGPAWLGLLAQCAWLRGGILGAQP